MSFSDQKTMTILASKTFFCQHFFETNFEIRKIRGFSPPNPDIAHDFRSFKSFKSFLAKNKK